MVLNVERRFLFRAFLASLRLRDKWKEQEADTIVSAVWKAL